jgi:hypothetical protein
MATSSIGTAPASALHATFDALLADLAEAVQQVYGSRLVGLGVFGSVGRRTMRPDSDIDLLIVAEPLPAGRMARSREFDAVERRMADAFAVARRAGVETRLSPVFKTPEELRGGSLLLLDMTEDLRLLVDPQQVVGSALDDFRARLERLGARRIWHGVLWHWDLKPDFRADEGFEL